MFRYSPLVLVILLGAIGCSDPTSTQRVDTLQQTALADPPVANAGEDQTVECAGNGEAEVTLDGSASSDPDGDPLTYTWSEDGNIIAGPTTDAAVTVTLGLGTHTIVLTVDDGQGGTATDEVVITIVDTQAPTIDMTVGLDSSWPPNHGMVLVAAGASASDVCCDVSLLIDVESDELANGKGDGNTEPDWEVVDNGDGTYDVWVRSERSGMGSGRTYTITATATDCSGNETSDSATVLVPHNM